MEDKIFKTSRSKQNIQLPARVQQKVPKLICYTNFSEEENEGEILEIKKAVEKLGNSKIENEINQETTHLVSRNEEENLQIIKAFIFACPVVKFQWIIDSLAANKWLDSSPYFIHKYVSDIELFHRQILGDRYQNMLLKNYKFFIHNDPNGAKEIIKLCRGSIAAPITNCKFVLSEQKLKEDPPEFNNAKQKIEIVTSRYIIDSVLNRFVVLPVHKKYKPK